MNEHVLRGREWLRNPRLKWWIPLAAAGGLVVGLGAGLAVWFLSGAHDGLPTASRPGNWVQVFSENFSDGTLSDERWTTCYWWDDAGCTNLSTGERQWYLPANVWVEGGHLHLEARAGESTSNDLGQFDYSSGMVTSGRHYEERSEPDRFSFRYGYVEVRAKVPRGQGLWPAIWLLPSDHESVPEIDIMEVRGHRTDILEMHYHYVDPNGRDRVAGHSVETVDMADGWHVYGIEWNPEEIIWYLDGVERWRFSDRDSISSESMYLLINLAVGGSFPGEPDDSTRFPARFSIDYVNIWQRPAYANN